MIDYKKNEYAQALMHFAFNSKKSSNGAYMAYDEVIPTSSQILSKLDSMRLILVLRTRFVHITSKIHLNCDRIFTYFGSNVYANTCLRKRSYAPALKSLSQVSHIIISCCSN